MPISDRVRTGAARAVVLTMALAVSGACGSEGPAKVCAAVEQHDVNEVKRLLDEGGIDLNADQGVSGVRCRPFVEALGALQPDRLTHDRRPYEIVQLMLDRGADPNSCWSMASTNRRVGTGASLRSSPRNRCALEMAADQQATETVKLLMARGAKVTGGAGAVAVISAAESNELELVKLLVEAGAPINEVAAAQGDHGSDRTALGAAVQFYNDDVVKYLEALPGAREFPLPGVTAGVKSALASATNLAGSLNAEEQEFMAAARKGDVATVRRALAAGVSVNRTDETFNTALMRAAGWGQTAVVEVLLAAGASLTPVRDGLTALHIAASRGHVDAIRRLAAAKAEINGRASDTSDTPLLSAVKGGHTAAVRTLIDLGADPNVSEHSLTALEYAIWRANTAVVRELLRGARANVNARHASAKESPLHGALWCRNRDFNVELIQTLIAAGADLNALNSEGDTPLKAAEKKRASETIPYYQTCYDAQIQVLRRPR